MIIKIVYIAVIFLVVKLVFTYLKKLSALQVELEKQKSQQKQTAGKDEDIIDADYTVVKDKHES